MLAGLLLVAPLVGRLDPGGLLIFDQVLGHPFIFGCTAMSLLVVAAGLGLRKTSSRRRVAGLLAVMVLGCIALLDAAASGVLSDLDNGTHVTNSAPAPQGKPYRVIMIRRDNVSDPIETVLIRQDHGLLTRQWVAACEGAYDLKAASWVGPDQLTITLQDDFDKHRNGETFVIKVNPSSGRPQMRTDSDLNCL